MAKPLTREQVLQNRAFLKALRRSRNVRLACRELGLKYGTMQHRRKHHPHFAQAWDAALAFAQARFNGAGRTGPKGKSGTASPLRTLGGEPVIVRLRGGKLQMRRAQPGKLTREAEQAFLAALSATCNIRLAAAAVGAAFNAFNRRRKKDPAFDREMRLALRRGYQRLELALLEAGLPGSHEHDDWRHNDPPAMPPMSVSQALQHLYLHQKEALLLDEPTPLRRRRGESDEARNERLAQMAEARAQRARELFEIAEAERMERGEPPWGAAGAALRRNWAEGRVALPDLAQVAARSRAGGTGSTAGRSKADPKKTPHHDGRALFGGWRIEDMRAQRSRRRRD